MQQSCRKKNTRKNNSLNFRRPQLVKSDFKTLGKVDVEVANTAAAKTMLAKFETCRREQVRELCLI